MIHLILHYLLALPDTNAATIQAGRSSVSAARKRKSMDLATLFAATSTTDDQLTPALSNLVDLILYSLRSESQQTTAVALQLVSVILRRHHRYAVTTLLRTMPLARTAAQRTIGAHDREMDFLMTLVADIGGGENLDESYENHVKDNMTLLEGHPCSQPILAPKSAVGTSNPYSSQTSIPGGPRDVHLHTLRSDDQLLEALLGILATFFVNSVETNLCLTETIIDLAACGLMRIEGWLLADPSKYTYDEDEDDSAADAAAANEATSALEPFELSEKAQIHALRLARRQPLWPTSQIPTLLLVLQNLVRQIQQYRTSIPRFDDLLHQRSAVFHADNSADPTATKDLSASAPIAHVTPRQSKNHRAHSSVSSTSTTTSRTTSTDPSPARPSAFDSLAQRIFPDLASPSPRETSPRGRKGHGHGQYGGGGADRSSGSSSSRLQPAYFMPPPPSSFQGQRSGSRGRGERSMERDGGVEGQREAFREVERGILERRIGMDVRSVPESPLKGVLEEGALLAEVSEEGGDEDGVTEDQIERADVPGDGDANDEEEQRDEGKQPTEQKVVSVSHVLTNVVVLQEFLLELAALIQVRAGLFGEVRFV